MMGGGEGSRKRERERMSVGGREEGDAHFDRAVAPAADELVGDEVDAVDLVGVPREVVLELVRLQVPYLPPCRDVAIVDGRTGRAGST